MLCDKLYEPYRAKQFTEQTDCRDQPTGLGPPGHIPVEDAVYPHNHTEAREYLRVVAVGHVREAEQPLRVCSRIEAPSNVVRARETEYDSVTLSVFHDFPKLA